MANQTRFLVALDASDRAPVVLSRAITLAEKLGAKLILLRASAVPVGMPIEAFVSTPIDIAHMLENIAKEEIQRQGEGVPPALLDKTIAVMGVPWDAICSTAKEEDVDMIIIGSHGYGGLDRLLGTTASRVVNHSDRSVLVVR